MPLTSGQYIQIAKAQVNGASTRSLSMTFGLSVSEVNKALSLIFISRDTPGYSSTSVRAKNQGIERDELFLRLHNEGMLEEHGSNPNFLTAKGFEAGGRFATDDSTSGSFWSVWPNGQNSSDTGRTINYDKVIEQLTDWFAQGQIGTPPQDSHSILSSGHDDGYLSTSKMAESLGASNKVALQLLKNEGFVSKVGDYWRITAKSVAKGGKLRTLSDGAWYPVWNPSSTVVRDCFRKAWKIKDCLKENFEYDSEGKLFFIDTYVPLTSAYEQDRFSEMLLGLKKKNRTSLDYFMNKLACLRNLDFYVCTVPGHDPKKSTGIDKLAARMSEEMLCGKLFQHLRRKRKVARQHFLSKSEKRSPGEEAKTLKLTSPEKFEGKRVLLIDDITTSGGTIKGAKKFIVGNTDAKEVQVLVLGKTMR